MTRPSSRAWLPLLIFLVSWGLTTHGKYSVTGDEPHYLVVAQSLWADYDLDLRNNYDAHDGAAFGASGLQPELHARTARDGRFLPVHDVGVPLVVLPAYIVATRLAALPAAGTLARFRMNRGLFAYSLVSLFVIAIVALAARVTLTALLVSGASPAVAAGTVAAAWLTAPVLSNSFLVFPEPFALLVTAWVVVRAAHASEWSSRDSLAVLALGLLPWLHRKYAVYALALLVALVWQKRGVASRLSRAVNVRECALFLLPQLALAAWTLHYWGNLAGPLATDRLPFSFGAFRDGAAGLWLDRENGLIWWAPAYALLPAAWWLAGASGVVWLLPAAALFIPSAAHDQWWGGFSPAARFLVPLVPVFCLVFAALVRNVRTRRLAAALLVPQAIIAAYGWQHARLLWPQGDGSNRVLSAILGWIGADDSWMPSFRTQPGSYRAAALIVCLSIAALNAVALRLARTRSGPL